jgi:PPOX class probable F420-dependent enzyme
MGKMTGDEVRAFLEHGTRTISVATVRADGRPHVAPVWFVLDGDDIVFNTSQTSVKGVNLLRDPRVSLVADDETPPYAFVMIEGIATLEDDLAQLRHWATEIARRYMGEELADAYGQRNGVPGEFLVRVRPLKVISNNDVTA